MKILLIEDDTAVSNVVAKSLHQERLAAVLESDGARAVSAARRHRPDLILLDLGLPGRSGLDVCRDLKADPDLCSIPVIIVTGLGDELDRIVGLELGADDYLVKPFSPRELVLRVKAVLRRMHGGPRPTPRRVGALTLDEGQQRAIVDERTVALTAKECGLLAALLEARGRILSREYLLRTVWGYEHVDHLSTRTVDVHVRQLRRKLGREAWRIETIKGVGYRLNPDTEPIY